MVAFWSSYFGSYAQPANDNCENANEIIISNNGFGFGTFFSAKVNIDAASRQKGEKCAKELQENGNCDKTVWFKFYIPTTRNISIRLSQKDSAIPQIFAGFNVYKIKDCNYSVADLALNLTPLNKFGSSGNTCLHQGWYYVQVGSKQKAKGDLWMELTSSAPVGQLYDNFNAPYDFGVVKDQRKAFGLVPSCASVEEQEAIAISDSLLNKSVFITFTLPPNSAFNLVEFYYTGTKAKYRIFKDNINSDSVYGNKSFISVKGNTYFNPVREICPYNTNQYQKYYIQFVSPSNDDVNYSQYSITISNNTNIIDAWNTPNTNDIITTNNSFTRALTHYYNCDGLMKNHACKNIIPPEFYRSRVLWTGETLTDTFNLAGYTVINVSEAGTLTVVSKDLQNYTATMFYAMYSGDITKNCNLLFVNSAYTQTFNSCISPGTYTLLTVSLKGTYLTAINHIITQKKAVLNTVHYYPKDPEQLGVFDPTAKAKLLSSGINFNEARDTTFKIDTLNLKGYFIYREFFLSQPSNPIIRDDNYLSSYIYVVKGRMSSGGVSLIKGYVYRPNSAFQLDNCNLLDAGYYTIICRMDTSKKTLSCVSPLSKVTIEPPFICTSNIYNEATLAYKINNNADVLTAAGNKKNLDYVFLLPLCSDCNSITKGKPYMLKYKKQFVSDQYNKFSFCTFYLGKNAEFRSPLGDHQFELFKGNASQTPAILKDSLNIVSACDNGSVYCNLEGGKFYTLVVFNNSFGGNLVAYFTPHQVSINDFANHAYDFGHLNSNGSKTSTPLAITCHTNGFDNEPCSWENGNKSCQRYSTNMVIPYKDTQNVKRIYTRKTLWYTFTVDNSSTIAAEVSANTPLLKNPKFNIFRYKGPYSNSFQATLGNNFDSTEKLMEWMATNTGYVDNSRNRNSNTTINNYGCALTRYFIILEDEYLYDMAHYEYMIKLTYTRTPLSNIGDFCSNAVADSLLGYGIKNISVNNTCHTYGNSPFETDVVPGTKSSWFRIKVANMKSCDIKIKNTSGNGVLYYNVYGGSCLVMTKIAHLADVYSYFTLSCMGPGNYYIQAVCSDKVNSNIAFEVTSIFPDNPKCKPYDFRWPIAQFDLIGGCNNDTLRLQNLSTSGSDISYTWSVNGNFLSNAVDPIIFLSDPLVKVKNTIKLLVTNTVDNLADTVTRIYDKDTNHYQFKITGPPFIICGDTAILKVVTNFPYKINYLWTDKYAYNPIHTPERMVVNGSTEILYQVQGESDNCRFSDSFLLRSVNTANRYRDTFLCDGQSYTIYAKPQDYFYLFYGTVAIQVKDSFKITTPGDYRMQYNYKGCTLLDTMHIDIDTGHITIKTSDSFYTCNGNVKLKFGSKLQNYKWSTGDTIPEITVNKSGIYVLEGDINSCRSIKYTVYLTVATVNANFLNNQTVCKGDILTFANPFTDFNIVKKDPQQNNIVATKSFKEVMILKKDRCVISDSALITVITPYNKWMDTMFCQTSNIFSLTLDAGSALTYYWMHDQSTGRYSTVHGFGKYIVTRTDLNTCKDTFTISVTDSCPFRLLIPNAFSPNGDAFNESFGPVLYGMYTSFTMRIFNRWGEILFETENSERWNGIYMEEPVQQSIYCYQITIKDYNGRQHGYKGTFLLLR